MDKMYEIASKLPIKYYAPIGEFIFRWAQLEYQMHEIIWRGLDIGNKKGRTVTIGMGARTLAAILGTLTLKWVSDPTDKQMLHSIAKGVRSLDGFRNQLAHGSWQYPQGGKKTDVYLHYMKEIQQRIMPLAKKHEPEEIKKKIGELKRLNEKAETLIARLSKQKP
jgi:hypothetical protein